MENLQTGREILENHQITPTFERLLEVVQELPAARDLETVMEITRRSVRALTGSDGATFVLREGNHCYYADEDTISPLWKGNRFPMKICISGWVMLNKCPAIVEDIYQDPRIPIDVYRKTFVKSLVTVPIKTASPIGAIGCYWATKHSPTPDEVRVLQILADTAANAIDNIQYQNIIAAKAEQLEKAISDTLMAVAKMVEQRDPYTAGHQRRVGMISLDMAKEMGWKKERRDLVFRCGIVHDIGKIGIPSELLSKPSKLTPFEFALIKVHPEAGYDILKDIPLLRQTAEIILQHHERYNGSGYPYGLRENKIFPEAHALAVADVFESMISHRPYRPTLGVEAALDELTAGRGTLYQPDAVDAIVELVNHKGYQVPD